MIDGHFADNQIQQRNNWTNPKEKCPKMNVEVLLYVRYQELGDIIYKYRYITGYSMDGNNHFWPYGIRNCKFIVLAWKYFEPFKGWDKNEKK